MDEIIDNAILRAGGLPLASPDLLSYLTMFTLRSLPRDLAGLGVRRFGGSWKEPRWTIGPLSYWVRRRIGSGLRWPAFFALSRTVTTRQVRRLLLITSTLRACSGLITWPAENPHPSSVKSSSQGVAHEDQGRGSLHQVRGSKDQLRLLRCSVPTPTLERAPLGSMLDAEQPLSVIGLLSCCFLTNSSSLSWAEYKMSLRMRLLRSSVSLDVGDAEGGILCWCSK